MYKSMVLALEYLMMWAPVITALQPCDPTQPQNLNQCEKDQESLKQDSNATYNKQFLFPKT